MIKTGISKMDELLAGGIPEGKSLAYYTEPGVDGEIFGLQTIYNTLKNGGNGVFVVSSTSPDDIRGQIRDINPGYEPNKDRLFFVDGYNALIGNPSKEKYVILNPYNIEEFSNSIINLLKESPPSTIVFGSLSTMMDLCGEKETIEAVKTWNNLGKLHGHILIYNFTAWSYSSEILDLIKRKLFNAVITIGGIIEYVIFSQYFGILKLDWKNEARETISLEPECSDDFQGMGAGSPKSKPYQYQIEDASVRIEGENNIMGFPSF